MDKIALLIIYNHRYDKNIPILDKMYESKFSHVYHIVPFYDGGRKNVIPVYASSFHFQSYIAQAYQHLKDLGFTHYFFVADDMILNPKLTENNLFNETGIRREQCYIYDIREIYDCFVAQHVQQMRNYCVKRKGVEVEQILPTKQEAESLFQKHDLRISPLSSTYLTKIAYYAYQGKMLRKCMRFILDIITHNVKINYPLVWGYSDILLIPSNVMNRFATYCGAFAANELFVEYAIPTSLIFSAHEIVTDDKIKLHGVTQIYPKKRLDMVRKASVIINHHPLYWEEEMVTTTYHKNIQYLQEHFPSEIFFIHPIKLSQWK